MLAVTCENKTTENKNRILQFYLTQALPSTGLFGYSSPPSCSILSLAGQGCYGGSIFVMAQATLQKVTLL